MTALLLSICQVGGAFFRNWRTCMQNYNVSDLWFIRTFHEFKNYKSARSFSWNLVYLFILLACFICFCAAFHRHFCSEGYRNFCSEAHCEKQRKSRWNKLICTVNFVHSYCQNIGETIGCADQFFFECMNSLSVIFWTKL